MKSTYTRAMKGIRISEGGYSNHPKDPGGATNFGIIQTVYDEYRSSQKLVKQSVKLITESEVNGIYKTRYADKVRYDELPAGIDYATLDGAVNSGVSRGAKWLQATLGISADGIVGAGTIAAAAKADAIKTVKAMCAKRMSFLRGLTIFSTFGKGWTSRVSRVEAESVSMAMEARGISARSLPIALMVESDAAATSSKAAKNSATASGAGAAGSAGTATQTDWSNLAGLESILLIGATAALVVLAIYLIHRSRVQSERAAAYAAVAAGVAA